MTDNSVHYLIPSLHEIVGVIIPKNADFNLKKCLPISDLVVMKSSDNQQLRKQIAAKKSIITNHLQKSKEKVAAILRISPKVPSIPLVKMNTMRKSLDTVKTEYDKEVKYQYEFGEDIQIMDQLLNSIGRQHYSNLKTNVAYHSYRALGVV